MRVSLRREVRVQTAAATARDRVPEDAPKTTAWYTTVSQDIKSGFQRLTKNIETSLVSTGDSLGEAGSAVGATAKAGYETTSAGANKVAEATKESSAVAGDALVEAGSKVKEAIGVDAAARARMSRCNVLFQCQPLCEPHSAGMPHDEAPLSRGQHRKGGRGRGTRGHGGAGGRGRCW